MNRRLRSAVIIGCCVVAGIGVVSVANAQATPKSALLVLSKRDRTLAIVDPATLKVVARVPVLEDPHEVIASSDGKTAYVSDYGGGRYHTLSVVDLAAQKPLPPIDLGPVERTTRPDLRRRRNLVYRRGREGHREIRPSD